MAATRHRRHRPLLPLLLLGWAALARSDEAGECFDQLAEQAYRCDHVARLARRRGQCSEVLQQAIDIGGIWLCCGQGIGEFGDTQQVDPAMQNHSGFFVQGLLLNGKQQRFLVQIDKVNLGENFKQPVQVEVVCVSSAP